VADILLAPYLPLSHQTRIGPWQLVPFGALDDSHAVPAELARPVGRLVEAYRVSSGGGPAMGVVALPEGSQVGASFERTAMRRLGLALLAGVVAGNPPMAVPEEDQEPNAGWAVATAENAILYGHPLTEGDSYAIETGVLARITAIRHAPNDDRLPSIAPPVELPRPLFFAFDEELAGAAHAVLCNGPAPARRLQRALDWYRIALSNAEAVSLDVRIGATRSALEILTATGDETKRLVRAYGRLVREDATTTATYDDVFWAKGPVQLTPDEWWVTRLCALRNAIVHGDEVPDELWHHEGHHQLNHIHDRLISALRIAIAEQAGDPLLRLAKAERLFPRLAQDVAAHLRQTHGSTGDPTYPAQATPSDGAE
jgi:hypothetical protein